MKVVKKFDLTYNHPIQLPIGAHILYVNQEKSYFKVWALVEYSQETVENEERKVVIIGTGRPDDFFNCRYINTFLGQHIGVVYHAFEIILGKKV